MDLEKLDVGDYVVGGSTFVFLIATFLPWFSVDFGFAEYTGNGWDVGFFWAGFPLLFGLGLCGLIAATKLMDVELPEAPWPAIMLGLGGAAALIVVLKLLIGEDGADRSFGLILATLAAIGMAVGAFLNFQKEQSGGGAAAGGGGSSGTPTQF